MRDYAITYQQLIRQAVRQGFPESDLSRLRTGYDLALRLTDGLYRKQMVPFICHLVRTASIVMHETSDLSPILASMLHAVCFLHVFSDSTRRGPRASDRHLLRDTLGDDVEGLIRDYSQFRFGAAEASHWANPAHIPDARTRQLLIMRLADELEDHLDAAEAFVPKGRFRSGDPHYGQEFVALARRLGLEALANDFQEALEISQNTRLPESLLSSHASSYELRNRLWKANVLERLGAWLRRKRMGRDA
jgi:(p)ppGpp synthase/HD superfamily hydrolase